MADEPQHPMEPRLRAWARSRRLKADPAFELHSADRAQLHREISRLQGAAPDSSTQTIPLWRALVPRLTLIGVLTALALVAIVQWAPRQVDQEASLETARLSKQATSPTPAEALDHEAPESLDRLDPGSPTVTLDAPIDPAPSPSARPRGQNSLISRRQAAPSPSAGPTKRESTIGAPPPAEATPRAPRGMLSEEQDRGLIADRYEPGVAASNESPTSAPRPIAPSPTSDQQVILAREVIPADSQSSMPVATRAGVAQKTSSVSEAGYRPFRGPERVLADSSDSVRVGATKPPPDWSASFVRQQAPRRNLNAPHDVALQSFKVEQRGQYLQVLDADGSVYRGRVRVGQSTSDQPVAQTSLTLGAGLSNGLSFVVVGTNRTSERTLSFQGLILTGATYRLQGRALLGGRDRIVVEAQELKP